MEQTVQAADAGRNDAMVNWYPMVERIARKAAASYGLPVGIDVDDLVSCGVLGLAEAWERYDPDRGVAFEAYAIPRIRGAVIDAMRAMDWVPRKARQRARQTGEAVAMLVSMDEQRAGGDGDQSMADRLADHGAAEPGLDLMVAEGREELLEALGDLPERERMIITRHYFERTPLQDLAKVLGVTESRVSQLHSRALKMLRASLEAVETATAA